MGSSGGGACAPAGSGWPHSTVHGVVFEIFVGALDGGGVEPAEADRKALAAEQRRGLVERQADDVGVGPHHLHHEGAGDALHGIAAGFAAPFAGADIGLDVVLREAFETDPGPDQALAEGLARRDETYR